MSPTRSLVTGRPWRVLLLAFVVLAARLAVPTGFMPMREPAGVALVPCAGMGPMAMLGGHANHPDKAPTRDSHQACGFAALADVATGGADAAVLATALAFVLASARLPVLAPPPLARAAWLRPPLRAPPAA